MAICLLLTVFVNFNEKEKNRRVESKKNPGLRKSRKILTFLPPP